MKKQGLRGYQVGSGGQVYKDRPPGSRVCVLADHRTLLVSNSFNYNQL